jgi:Ca-activated chloride channel family protein
MVFYHPKYLFLLFILLPLIAWYIYKLRLMQAAFKISSTSAFSRQTPSLRVILRHLPFALRCVAIALVIVVLARPQSVSTSEVSKTEGIDIVVALDVSGSMLAQDFNPNRLEAAKMRAQEFIASRENDKIGLVIFAGESFTQCPLTTDRNTLLRLLNSVSFNMLRDGTALGMGLATAVNRIKDSEAKSKVIILLTDGSNNAGNIAPLTAAELAKGYAVRVYTIGVGSRGIVPYPDGTGHTVLGQADIDEKTLKEIANLTGGQYYRATDENSLQSIYSEIDAMEKYLISMERHSQRKELFFPFALAALCIVSVELVLRRTVFQTIP